MEEGWKKQERRGRLVSDGEYLNGEQLVKEKRYIYGGHSWNIQFVGGGRETYLDAYDSDVSHELFLGKYSSQKRLG